MSFPLITCPLCGSQVSKRSTILVEPYGRICRNHPEVEQHKEKLAQLAAKATEDKKLEKAMQNLQVMMIVEQFRMLAHMSGQSLELTLLAFLLKVPQSIRGEVENQVRERGPITLDKRIACLEADRTDAMHKRDYQKQIECIQKKQEATLIREAIALGSAVVRGEN